MTTQRGIDPRAPRFAAGITAALLLVAIGLALPEAARPSLGAGFWLLAVIAALFAWSAAAGVVRSPYGLLFRGLVRPKLSPPAELEDPAPPTFAQGVGFVVTAAGIVLHLLGVPYALVGAASAAFLAAFLNAAFGYCLGCQIYLLLARAGVLRRTA